MQEVPVRVAVRVRPFLPQEKLHHHESCVRVIPNTNQVIVGRDRAFTFDHVLPSKINQEEVYKVCVSGLVTSFFEGYNATVFAYGQTGSGKTYTVGGHNATNLTEDEYGIIPRAIQHMFHIIKENHNVDFNLHVSYIEIYKEELKDLLDLETNSKEMHIREDEHGNTVVIGATEITCDSLDDVLNCLSIGSTHRHTGATNMNEVSSRSHSIFTIALHQQWEDPPDIEAEKKIDLTEADQPGVGVHTMSAKFHFVDLAGSERAHKTGNAGERFKESVYINSGLLSLGNVISALSDPKRRGSHIPYRDSKITRILKDSLGGNAKTCMINCISPSAVSFDETLNSLKYANRARNITNKPIINRDVNSCRIAAMQTEIQELREELQRHQSATHEQDRGADSQRVKALESSMIRYKTSSAHYQACTEEAMKLLTSLQDSDHLSDDELTAIRDWMDLAEEARGASTTTDETAKGHERARITQLEKQLKKALADLASDEEIFSTKNKENNDLLGRIKKLEAEHEETVSELEDAMSRLHQQEQDLIEQQTLIHELQEQNKVDYRSESHSLELPSARGIKRPMSVPAHLSGLTRAKSAADVDAKPGGRPQSRKLHTSPPLFGSVQTSLFSSSASFSDQVSTYTVQACDRFLNTLFSMERIVQGFKARSHLILKRLEEQDEVMQWEMSDSSNDGNDDNQSGALGKTWSRSNQSRRNSDSKLQGKTKRTSSNKNFGGTLTKETAVTNVKNLPHVGSAEMTDLSASTMDYHQKVRESKLRVHEAQEKMRDLALNIRLKEELIRELVKTGREAETANKKFSERIQQLETEAHSAKTELHDAQDALQRLGAKEHQETHDKEKLGEEYRRKMDKAKNRMKELQQKQKETEKVLKVQGQSNKKVSDLELAVGRMKQHQELLQQRLKDEADRKLKLEKEWQKDQQRIRELEIRMEQQQKILKRKTEEVVVAQRKLRHGNPHNDEQVKFEEQKKWLDSEADKVLERKRKVKELEQELTTREDIIAKKEGLLKEKGELEMRRLRSSQTLNKDLSGLSSKIQSVEKQLEEKNSALRVSVEALSHDITSHIKTLKHDRDRLMKQRNILDAKLGQGTLLSPTEERRLIELDEGVDALDAAIDFKNEVIASRQQELKITNLTTSEEVLAGRLCSLSAADNRSLLMRYFEKVVDLRETDKKKDLTITEMEMKVDEQSRLMRELEGALQRSAMELDRKLMSQQKQHEQRVQMLLRQQTDSDGNAGRAYEKQISDLEKDLYYYKKISRELKRKLRQIVTESTPSGGQDGKGEDETGTSHHLTKEDGDDRRSQDSRRGVTPVRKARKEVRELSLAELSVRRSGASQASFVADSIEREHKSNGSSSANNPWN
ncbi:kinesin-like protein KIF27 isoform X2 [Asterias rubens]|uniref:kinesin-like protein KIF27 isoform X2 n=1 Tax=Asterias rubens TaxID=7604 RepID=UPI0014552CC2|nr:kinesin-like protein KIF27 isoform X2 [Asterias rubens]